MYVHLTLLHFKCSKKEYTVDRNREKKTPPPTMNLILKFPNNTAQKGGVIYIYTTLHSM